MGAERGAVGILGASDATGVTGGATETGGATGRRGHVAASDFFEGVLTTGLGFSASSANADPETTIPITKAMTDLRTAMDPALKCFIHFRHERRVNDCHLRPIRVKSVCLPKD